MFSNQRHKIRFEDFVYFKNVKKYQNLANVGFFSYPDQETQISIMLRECQNESGVYDGLQPVAWTILMLRGTPEYVQFISTEGLGPTKLNPANSIFAFPQHFKRKSPKSRTDPEERRRTAKGNTTYRRITEC